MPPLTPRELYARAIKDARRAAKLDKALSRETEIINKRPSTGGDVHNWNGGLFTKAIEAQPMPPCVGCKYFNQCATELMACKAYYSYTREPEQRKENAEWRTMERNPTKKRYLKTFKVTQATPQADSQL